MSHSTPITSLTYYCDALAVEKPIWMLGDSAYDTLDWHDHLLAAGVVPVAPYNARNTDDPKDIEYRVEARIDEHSVDVQLKQSTLDETYNRRVESNEPTTPSRTAASGTSAPEAASTHEHKCSRAVPSSRRCNHQRRTRRQSRKHRHHAMRTIL